MGCPKKRGVFFTKYYWCVHTSLELKRISCKGQVVCENVTAVGVGVEKVGCAGVWSVDKLTFTRYCFMARLLYTSQYYYLQTAPWFGHPPPRPTAHTVAQYIVPPPIPLCCNICYIILVLAKSCKGKWTGGVLMGGTASRCPVRLSDSTSSFL